MCFKDVPWQALTKQVYFSQHYGWCYRRAVITWALPSSIMTRSVTVCSGTLIWFEHFKEMYVNSNEPIPRTQLRLGETRSQTHSYMQKKINYPSLIIEETIQLPTTEIYKCYPLQCPARGWRCLSGRGGGGWGGRGGDRERVDALRSGSLVPADNSATINERRNSNSSEGYGGGVILWPDKPVGGEKKRRPD